MTLQHMQAEAYTLGYDLGRHHDLVPRVPPYQTPPLYLPILPTSWHTYTLCSSQSERTTISCHRPESLCQSSPFRKPLSSSVFLPAAQLLFHKVWFMGHHCSRKIFQIPQIITLFSSMFLHVMGTLPQGTLPLCYNCQFLLPLDC